MTGGIVIGKALVTYLGHVDDGVVLSLRVQLLASGVLNSGDVPGILDYGELHAKTYS